MPKLSLEVAAQCARVSEQVVDEKRHEGVYPPQVNMGRCIGDEFVAVPHGQVAPNTGFNGAQAHLIIGRSNTSFTHPFGVVMPGEDTRRNEMLISFRGSHYILQDYIGIDLAMAPGISTKGFMVHGGFNTVFKSCRSAIDGAINSLLFERPNSRTIHITGHSMGGALATLCAEYLAGRGFTVYLYTFGAPRVGLAAHARYLWDELGTNIHRYYYANDFITWLPILPYWHVPGIKLKSPYGNGFFARGSHGEYFNWRGQQLENPNAVPSPSGLVSQDFKAEINGLLGANPARVRCFSAVRILSKALGMVLRTVVGGALFVGVTVLDQVVHALTFLFNTNRADNQSVVLSIVKYAMKYLGLPFVSAGKCIKSFLRYVFERFFATVKDGVREELQYAARYRPRPVVRFN